MLLRGFHSSSFPQDPNSLKLTWSGALRSAPRPQLRGHPTGSGPAPARTTTDCQDGTRTGTHPKDREQMQLPAGWGWLGSQRCWCHSRCRSVLSPGLDTSPCTRFETLANANSVFLHITEDGLPKTRHCTIRLLSPLWRTSQPRGKVDSGT